MAKMPSSRDLASYYCAQYLGPLICRAFGPVPKTSDIHFAFDVDLKLANSSKVPHAPGADAVCVHRVSRRPKTRKISAPSA